MNERSPLLLCKTELPVEISEEIVESGSSKSKSSFSLVENFLWIELPLLTNVFLAGFDGTVAASTYTTIGNEFGAVDIASWITASYLITATAFQPLYGSLSDNIGRRICIMFALTTFAIGCLGCSIAPNMLTLNLMRAVTGIGGGGLITLSTIINSDIVIPKQRGLFQAFQNLLLGCGAICGASLSGLIADSIGWRFCFIVQVPPALLSIFVAYRFVLDQPGFDGTISKLSRLVLLRIDIKGSVVLVLALTSQLLVLTLGGNELPWTDYKLFMLGSVGVALSIYFFYVENNTIANPIIPVTKFSGLFGFLQMGLNFLIGLSSYAYIFTLPLFFQIELGDTPSKAGFRLIIPALATPIGGIISGMFMARFNCLRSLVYFGSFIMSLGNFLALLIRKSSRPWLLNLLLVPANLGQGLVYPSSLFTFVLAFGSQNQATSTSTIYLMRSIGGVWGVSGVAAIIQGISKFMITNDLQKIGGINDEEISKIIYSINKSTEAIYLLPDNIKLIVLNDFETAIKVAQFVSAVSCLLAFFLFFIGDVLNAKPKKV